MNNKILELILDRKLKGHKSVAILIDPDKVNFKNLPSFVKQCEASKIHYFLVGGSLIYSENFENLIITLKSLSKLPVIIFPGNNNHIVKSADALLLLSLVSGRNPEYLIGQHVTAAPMLRRSGLELLSTAYLLIDSGQQTTVSYISNTMPIPSNKPEIAATTALAAEMIGMKLSYLDGGSGAKFCINSETIRAVSKSVSTPIIVGGGIDSSDKIENAFASGADIVVIGNAIEKDPDFIYEIGSIY